ncbi:MAG: peptidoglycan DD-metalloendopeptidase family protein [Pseudomonadota bacterium]
MTRIPTTTDEAAHALEATLVRQLLSASGAFRASQTPGAQIHADMFVEVMADAVAARDGLGLARTLERALPADAGRSPPAAEAAPAATPAVRQTGGFGTRIDPIDGTEKFHTGIDLAAAEGTPVTAVSAGIVRAAGQRGGYGNAVEIDHGGGVTTLYGHASRLTVSPGDRVEAGQAIAAVGQTGRATGPHLHFEVRVDGVPRDPIRALNAYGIRAESPFGKGTQPVKP